jgi:hypothetical protein
MITFVDKGKEETMFIILAIILALAWVFGFTIYHVASAGIHLLLLLAAVSLVVHFIRGARARVT